MWRLRSRTYKLALVTAVLGAVQAVDLSFLTPEVRAILTITIAVVSALLREDTTKPIEEYKA